VKVSIELMTIGLGFSTLLAPDYSGIVTKLLLD